MARSRRAAPAWAAEPVDLPEPFQLTGLQGARRARRESPARWRRPRRLANLRARSRLATAAAAEPEVARRPGSLAARDTPRRAHRTTTARPPPARQRRR